MHCALTSNLFCFFFDGSHRWEPDLKEWIMKPEYETEHAKNEREARKMDEEAEEAEKQEEESGETVKTHVPVDETRPRIELEKETSGLAHRRQSPPPSPFFVA